MGINSTTLAAARKYTNETAAQFGGLKGASCKIKSIEHQNGQSIVTFEWKNDLGETRESVMYVQDGTPIYNWVSGDTYGYGDLVIYASCFYRCIVANSDVEFDDTKWNELGSPDGNYDIVQNSSLLPPRFTSADRKMYYSIEDIGFYLWDGYEWTFQKIGKDRVFYVPISYSYETGYTTTITPKQLEDAYENGDTIIGILENKDIIHLMQVYNDNFEFVRVYHDEVTFRTSIWFYKLIKLNDNNWDEITAQEGDSKGQAVVLPTPSVNYSGQIYQYTGISSQGSDLVTGYFYRCEYNESSQEWHWVQINTQPDSTPQTPGLSGTYTFKSMRNANGVKYQMLMDRYDYANMTFIKNFHVDGYSLGEGIIRAYVTGYLGQGVVAQLNKQDQLGPIQTIDNVPYYMIQIPNTVNKVIIRPAANSYIYARFGIEDTAGRLKAYNTNEPGTVIGWTGNEQTIDLVKCRELNRILLNTDTDNVFMLCAFCKAGWGAITENWESYVPNIIYVDNDNADQIQYSAMPMAVASRVGHVIQYLGPTDANYTRGLFYRCESDGLNPPTYSWVKLDTTDISNKVDKVSGKQLSTEDYTSEEKTKLGNIAVGAEVNVQSNWTQTDSNADDYIKNKPTLGTAAYRFVTDDVQYNNTNCVTSRGVYSAINSAISTAYKPSGDITCAELLPALLVEANLGNVYNVTDSGTTTSDFKGGADKPIHAGDNIGIVKIVEDDVVSYKFDLMAGFVDLSGKQDVMQYATMPTASEDNLGQIKQFTGATDVYHNGYFYKCVSDGANPPVYSWVPVEVQNVSEKANKNMIATEEDSAVAVSAHPTGTYFIDSVGMFTLATDDIAIGDTIEIGVNASHTDIATILVAINTSLATKEDAGTIPVNPTSTEGMNIWIETE